MTPRGSNDATIASNVHLVLLFALLDLVSHVVNASTQLGRSTSALVQIAGPGAVVFGVQGYRDAFHDLESRVNQVRFHEGGA